MFNRKNIINIVCVSFSVIGIVASLALLIQQYSKNADKSYSNELNFPSQKFQWEKNVLFISSYDFYFPATQLQLETINDIFEKEQVHLDAVFMDNKRSFDEYTIELFKESLKNKIKNNGFNYDAVLLGDDAALRFAMESQDELFNGLPMVYFGVENNANLSMAQEFSNIKGFEERHYIRETIAAALKLDPSKHHVIALCDNSLTGQGDARQFEEIASQYDDISFEIINGGDYTFEQLKYGLHFIPKNSIFIFLTYSRDKDGQYISLPAAVNMVCESVPGPVFACTTGIIGTGVLGGKIYDCKHASTMAANTILQVLNGTDIKNIDANREVSGYFCYDMEVAKKYGFKKSAFPEDSVLLYKEHASFVNNGRIYVSLFIIFICLIMLLVITFANFRTSQKHLAKLKEKNKEIEDKNYQLKTSAMTLHYMSENDYLTTLPNRMVIVNHIRGLVEKKADFSVMMLDIDDFKFINDYYTHACGDFVLCEIGKRLLRISSEFGCSVARYGGDEFLLVDEKGILNPGSPQLLKIREILTESLEYNSIKMRVFTSSGVAHYDRAWGYDELMGNADIALYESKKAGKNQTSFYEYEMRSATTEKNSIVKILDKECSSQGFSMRYQPQVNAVSGEVLGYEALVRLSDSAMSPGKFIPVAEDSGYITQIGRIVTEKVISQMAAWRDSGMKLNKVAINYSNGQLVDSEYVDFLKSTLEKYNIPPSLVEIEITESLFLGNTNLTNSLFKKLQDLGVSLALDDFGTGYSSLSYLTYVPVHKVKIDKSLVDNYLVDGKETFIKNIVRLVHDLGMELTVEGIEHKWQYDMLKKLNCDTIQGYYFSKPITAEEVETLAKAV